jgi:acetyl esterase
VLYPLWPDLGMTEELDDAAREHQGIKELLARDDPGGADFGGALRELIDLTRHHVDDEEREELPEFRRRAGAERMAQLGQESLVAKRKVPTRPHPHAPDEGVAERITGALTAPVDHLRDEATGRRGTLGTDASGLLDEQAQVLVDVHSGLVQTPFEVLEPDQARKQPGLDAAVRKLMAQRGLSPAPVADVRDLRIPDAAGGEQTLRVYTPERVAAHSPIIVWVHGGGWVLSDLDTCDAVLAAFRWVAANGRRFGGDPLRSQGQQFAAHLKAAGVDVVHEHYDGVMHEFFEPSTP